MIFVSALIRNDFCLLLLADDGNIKIWRNFFPESETQLAVEMVSAWQAVTDMLPTTKGAGLVADWDQSAALLYASGDVRSVRVWDVQKELKVQVSL